MKLKTSDKTAVFGKKPYIKKGYYPAQLLSVEPYSDKEGNLIEGTYGHQLIFEFVIFSKDENDRPVKPMTFTEEGKEAVIVKIPKFVYHEYKSKDKPGEFQTAITPNSAITKLLVALGWTFSSEDVDPEKFIGAWVEANIDDYKTKTKEGTEYTASSIKDINPYEGEEVKDVESVEPTKKPQAVSKQVKHEAVEKSAEDLPKIAELEKKKEQLEQMHKDGVLTEDGLNQSLEKINADIEDLKKQ